jgi:LmbE family N-acetylglucosaminyl deacetylase
MVTPLIEGDGTIEAAWRPWLAAQEWPPLDTGQLTGRRVVVLAAHPDDEVLGVGGLLRRLAPACQIHCVWATDGEASHPGSTAARPAELAMRRRAESARALERLGVQVETTAHLGLPDSGLAGRVCDLVGAFRLRVRDGDVVLAPWRDDGHPDHEAVGAAAAQLPSVTLIEYPIWMWHWASPADPRVAWHRMRDVADIDVAAKTAAVSAFETQIAAIGPDPADAAVLPPEVRSRFERSHELVFV